MVIWLVINSLWHFPRWGVDVDELRVVLIDFGLAEGFASTSSGCSGTAGYIPPETWETERWYPKGAATRPWDAARAPWVEAVIFSWWVFEFICMVSFEYGVLNEWYNHESYKLHMWVLHCKDYNSVHRMESQHSSCDSWSQLWIEWWEYVVITAVIFTVKFQGFEWLVKVVVSRLIALLVIHAWWFVGNLANWSMISNINKWSG